MKIPPHLEKLLDKDQRLHGVVLQTLGVFELWLKDNKVVFFPEYTDHGPEHVESVMHGAEALIREEAWPHLTAQDAATLLLAILLHDCAMHLSEDGFLALVSAGAPWKPRGRLFLDRMGDHPWPRLWQEFLREAARFDEGKLRSLFGDTEPARNPDTDWKKWTYRDRLLIGEFMRRHHARLAHEIALLGIPGPGIDRLGFAQMDEWLRDLAGFVARSHNLDLRASADLMPKNGRRNYREVHAPFAMAVLRIADYLEIEAPRAPRELLRVRSLKSPISQAEWRKHEAVVHVRQDEADPEALFVDAEPTDVKTFLGLRRLFQGIQAELDACWAVLGEVYGADTRLRELGLRVRRLRSTLDDVAAFGKTVDYLPVDARFRVSGGEVLKLLVGPLYEEEPAFGVRELMQNAVDACREREDYQRQNPDRRIDLPELEADVVVLLEDNDDGTGWLTVEDRGIGMSPDVVQKYFLTAGASFRNSEAWHRQHDDESGTPRVLRAGRFGVGALAAFLLGDEMEVTTRHVEEDRGVAFTARLDEPAIELRWCERKPGTTVRVRISNSEVMDRLLSRAEGESWDWYWLERPTLVRKILLRNEYESYPNSVGPTDGEVVLKRRLIPLHGAPLPLYWIRTCHPDFDDIQYTWNEGGHGTYVHNGFVLREPYSADLTSDDYQHLWYGYGWSEFIRRPRISIFDRTNKMPVNLVRTGLSTGDTPVDAVVLQSVCRDILGALLVRTPAVPNEMIPLVIADRFRAGLHPSIGTKMFGWSWLWWSQAGIGLADGAMASQIAMHPICFAPIFRGTDRMPAVSWVWQVLKTECVVELQGFKHDSREDLHNIMAQWMVMFHDPLAVVDDKPFERGPDIFGPFSLLTPRSTLLIVCRALWEAWRAIDPRPETIQYASVGEHWVLEWTGEDNRKLLDLERLATIVPEGIENPIGIWFDCEGPNEDLPDEDMIMSPLAEAWEDIIRHPVIPWDEAERRALLPHAYSELSEEITRWEAVTKLEQEQEAGGRERSDRAVTRRQST
ncbi:HD domain-containing protein [Polyangium jinanense]|uniref:ATP-binding protein n=1 Tax=Polyangium jinanense TaxID=2829994 RepID=A0A9X3X8S3_9BACT|nr:ATP-binding protein [Polyangium jinanense]MDC3959826.1 ATP-binding protein [Polyangium jinanense]MDC3986277.1 ATP-binding protein [Polyangium jinanense]